MDRVEVPTVTLWPSVCSSLLEASKFINPLDNAEAAFFLAELLTLLDSGLSIMRNVSNMEG